MSKFLKFIVALILIVFIGAGAALIVPPFFGVEAVVVGETTESELAMGTTIYAKTLGLDSLTPGTKVLTQDSNSAHVFTVRSYDAETGIAETEEGQALSFQSAYKKVFFSVPLIGYLSIATQSQMGLIILLLLLALVVILFIISEVLRKAKNREDEDDDEEDDDDEFYSGLVEKRRRREKGEPAQGPYTLNEETPEASAPAAPEESLEEEAQFRDIFAEEAVVSLGDAASAPAVEAAVAGEAVAAAAAASAEEEISAAVPVAEDAPASAAAAAAQPASSAAQTAYAESADGAYGTGGEETLPDVQAALEAALENQQLGRTETIQLPPEAEQLTESADLPPAEVELAIPAFTADELIQKAYSSGKDPTVIRDETTGITLVDYSDCI